MDKYIFLLLLFITGCTTITGMTEWDKKAQEEGLILHCTEVLEDECITHQWLNTTSNTYQRY